MACLECDIELIKSLAPASNYPPLLFVHGAWHAAWYWETHFLDYFQSQGFDAYAMSFRKHGTSPCDQAFNQLTLQDYVDDVKRVVDSLDQLPILIGHSMGGMVVQKYLEKYTCHAVVLMAPVPPTGVLRSSLKYLTTFPLAALKGLSTFNLHALVDTPTKVKWAFYEDHIAQQQLTHYAGNLQQESFRAYLNMLFPAIQVNHHTQLPMLVISGGKDNIFTVKEGQQTATKYQADFINFPHAAHNMMLGSHWKSIATYMSQWIFDNVEAIEEVAT
ncbi:MAG: alpha/beta hydrolase [Flammeovirgaceae bacterium]